MDPIIARSIAMEGHEADAIPFQKRVTSTKEEFQISVL